MFIPHTDKERQEMLKTIGKNSIKDLFADIPESKRFPVLDLPVGIPEMEAYKQMRMLAYANNSCEEMISFLGAGAYNYSTDFFGYKKLNTEIVEDFKKLI